MCETLLAQFSNCWLTCSTPACIAYSLNHLTSFKWSEHCTIVASTAQCHVILLELQVPWYCMLHCKSGNTVSAWALYCGSLHNVCIIHIGVEGLIQYLCWRYQSSQNFKQKHTLQSSLKWQDLFNLKVFANCCRMILCDGVVFLPKALGSVRFLCCAVAVLHSDYSTAVYSLTLCIRNGECHASYPLKHMYVQWIVVQGRTLTLLSRRTVRTHTAHSNSRPGGSELCTRGRLLSFVYHTWS